MSDATDLIDAGYDLHPDSDFWDDIQRTKSNQDEGGRHMMGMDKEVDGLRIEAEIKEHTGFCFDEYSRETCWDCWAECECLKLFVKEKAEVESRTINRMKEVQDGKSEKL